MGQSSGRRREKFLFVLKLQVSISDKCFPFLGTDHVREHVSGRNDNVETSETFEDTFMFTVWTSSTTVPGLIGE